MTKLDLFFYIIHLLSLITIFITIEKVIKFYETSKLYKTKAFVSSFIILLISILLKDTLLINIIVLFTLICMTFYFIQKIDIVKSFLTTVFIFLFYLITKLFLSSTFVFIDSANLSELFEQHIIYSNIGAIDSILLSIALIVFVIHSNLVEKFNCFMSKLDFKCIIFILIVLLILIIPQPVIMYYNILNNTPVFILGMFLQIFCTLTITTNYVFKSFEREKLKKELELLKLNIDNTTKISENISLLNHNLANILQAINGYISIKDFNGLERYVSSLNNEFLTNTNFICIDKTLLDEPALYGIILSKAYFCKENEIKFNINVSSKLSNINFSIYKLSKVLGILLDNAIEAALLSKDKVVQLNIEENFDLNGITIEVINTFKSELTIDINKIFVKNFSTKKIKSGQGLWEVKNIVNSSKNAKLTTMVEDNLFIQKLDILFNYY